MLKWISRIAIAGALGLAAFVAPPAMAADNVGPEKCQECHRAEYGVWEGTKHFESLRNAHKHDSAKAIVEAVGGKSMRREDTCATCHYTVVGRKAEAGPSCESCHGAASAWLPLHNDLGGPTVKPSEEAPAHKQQRLAAAKKAGMIHSSMLLDIAENCNGCHTLANVSADVADKMIGAGHPINGDYELVAYSQGSVRHRFYPPDITKNKEMTKAELATTFLTGHAAGLVFASKRVGETGNAKYKAAMEQRIASAQKAIGAVKGQVGEAGTLLSSPTEANARKFVDAIRGKDLSGAVGGMLPSKYK
ncbi:MAG: multiheme c-type cytochrome [Alphaproteobacteria bacterium]